MKKPIGGYALIALSLTLAGCTGTIRTVNDSDCKDKPCEGIPVRVMENHWEYYAFTTINLGNVPIRLCTPELLSRDVSAPSRERHYVYYEPKWFEKHKLSVALHADGTLKSVNAESTPAEILKKAFETAKAKMEEGGLPGRLSSVKPLVSEGQGDISSCNAGPVTVFKRCAKDENESNCRRNACMKWKAWAKLNERHVPKNACEMKDRNQSNS